MENVKTSKELLKEMADKAVAAKEAAKAAQLASKVAKTEAKELRAKLRDENKALKAAKKERGATLKKNGVGAPREGTHAAEVWLIAETVSTEKSQPADYETVKLSATAKEIKPSSIRSAYNKWLKFRGLEMRLVAIIPTA
jgi:glucan-binding YG repeat protein